MKDLLVLAADKNAEYTLKGLMQRIPGIEFIPEFSYDIITHPRKDPGVANQAVEYVRPYINDYRYLMVLFDYEGCGMEDQSRSDLEERIENNLNRNGWQNRNICVLFCPELESWLWVNSTVLHNVMEWDNSIDVYAWIISQGYIIHPVTQKPVRPKEAFEAVLLKNRSPRSSSLYYKIAQQASYKQCVDPSFEKFIYNIKKWFTLT